MKIFNIIHRFSLFTILCSLLVLIFVSSGCTVNHNGMTLPNGTYLNDTVEYYPHGSRYQFSNEASHLQELRYEQLNNK
ncbi:MAG: hypothetical protein LBT09_09380 [Planctomycetaceae bacterium]|jgi:hypothetical protein|nr:hypothetical protein [Planctomycetaceae bacterium]